MKGTFHLNSGTTFRCSSQSRYILIRTTTRPTNNGVVIDYRTDAYMRAVQYKRQHPAAMVFDTVEGKVLL